jgi:cytidylate kinase
MVIAIDGPAGTGKSTVARELASKIKFKYVDSGALYRAVSLKVLEEKIDLANEDDVSRIFREIDLTEEFTDGKVLVFCNGINISEKIRTPEVDKIVSLVAKQSGVRYHVTTLLHIWGAVGNIVIEGRDIGTFVFPDADYKFYLDASPRVRAERRYNEFLQKGFQGTLDDIEKQIIERDKIDQNRELAPLKPAKDAIIIDTSTLSIQEVVDRMASFVGRG